MLLGMGTVFVLFILAGGAGLMSLQQSRANFVGYLDKDEVLLQDVNFLYAQGLQMGQALRNVTLNPADKKGHANFTEASKEFDDALKLAIGHAEINPAVQKLLLDAGSLRSGQQAIQARVLSVAPTSQASAIEIIRTEETQTWRGLKGKLLEAIKVAQQSTVAAKDTTITFTNNRIVITLVLMLSATIIGVLLSFWLIVSITQSVGEAVHVANRVAQGDLTNRIEVKSKDEIGELMLALRNMNDSLLDIVNRVRSGTATIATGSAQIAAGNQDLSSRTEQQASSLEETASSMEELTSTVRQNGDNANQANRLAVSASDIAVKGGAIVNEVVAMMENISESSKKMAEIINVIDGIAFQTNILALNAAVEAARAGEQGRGFAVVATEVRTLAQRSANAAREIKALIDESVGKVEAGSKLVNQAGETMTEIVHSVQRVTDIMTEINAATREQVEGIEQVNQAVSQMDQVTQQNAALVEEAAAATESMQGQARELVQVVSVFNTGQSVSSALVEPLQSTKVIKSVVPVRHLSSVKTTIQKTGVAEIVPLPLMQGKLARVGGSDWEEF